MSGSTTHAIGLPGSGYWPWSGYAAGLPDADDSRQRELPRILNALWVHAAWRWKVL